MLGSAALVAPIAVHVGVIRREVPLTLLASAAFGLTLQGGLTRMDGVLLLLLLGACLGLLLRWAQALVWGAIGLAHAAGLPEGFIGVTVVAVGTSLPELVAAAQASRRGETDLIVGNLLGSNLFNALAVGGMVALIRPLAAAR